MITIGTIGLLLLVLAWIPQTIYAIRTKKINKTFTVLYASGSFLLMAYSAMVQDTLFVAMNMTAFALSATTLYAALR